jgi:hypothetical protein
VSRPLLLGMTALLGGLIGGCDFGSGENESGTTASSSTDEISIHSSLEGMAVLPRHVAWTATVSLPPEQVKEVQFRINRRPIWVDTEAPYSYGEPGALLVTSFSYGERGAGAPHRFTVRVVGTDGSTWRKTVVARVKAPRIAKHAPVYGIWGRLPPEAVVHHRSARQVGPYTAWLSMKTTQLWVGRTIKHAYLYELSASTRRLLVGPPIFLGSHDMSYVLFGWTFKGYQCPPNGRLGRYKWSWTEPFGPFNEQHLVLKAMNEPCSRRQQVMEGVWELVD